MGAVRDVLAAEKLPLPANKKFHVRAALAMDDALSRALGRPNREQVVTRRDTLATMLQALELVNGTTLDSILNQAAKEWVGKTRSDSRQIVERAFRDALGRSPTDRERTTATVLVGTPASVDGVHDLLWMVMMLPEFQLIN